MDILRIAGATLNQVPLDWNGNTSRILKLLSEAKKKGVSALCLPELSISGYNCEDMFLSLNTARQSMECLLRIKEETSGIMLVVGLPVFFHGTMYNCVAVLQNKKIVGIVPKKVLPKGGVHYEPRWFKAWQFGKQSDILIEDKPIPFGDLRFQFGKVGIGIEICEEAWGSQGSSAQAISGTEIIMNPSASHFALGKYKTRETLVADASRAMQVHYLYSNLVGLEDGRIVFDGGVLLGQCGKITARGPRFGFSDGELLIHDVDLDIPRVGKLANSSFNHDIVQALPKTIQAEPFVNKYTKKLDAKSDCLAKVSYSKEEEFLQAEILGLFDYLRKTRSKGYVISLSGGCDSATCAVLVGHMIAEAHKALGAEGLCKILGTEPKDPESIKSWTEHLLTLVYQGTDQSGEVTLNAARALAEELGASFHDVNVQSMVNGYTELCESILGRKMSWEEDDLSLQNIQARSRGPLVWMLANVKNALLISTSNRSEAAVGYATMDGDTAGGLSPLAGIDKSFLRKWLVWAENLCTIGLGPVSSLRYVNEQQPTAELRPSASGQTDEEDLMPYDVLEAIERYFIRDRMGPDSVLDKLEQDFSDYGAKDLKGFLLRFLRLWSRNQWKRERYAPSFHLDELSLDPKSWCRFPILSAGFQKEIDDL